MNDILFYGTKGAYGFFSNFAPYPITVDGKVWPTAEHYFQAQKFLDPVYAEKIRGTPSPMIAARLGRSRAAPLRPDWEEVKEAVMLVALRAKFTQHPPLGEFMLATSDAGIVEHTANDKFWADGGDGRGKNVLGQLLMKVRRELREAAKEA